jgi:hypothetical protein
MPAFSLLIRVDNEKDLLFDFGDVFSSINENQTLTQSPIFEYDIKDHIQDMYVYNPRESQRSRELRGKLFRLFYGDVDDEDMLKKEPWAVLHFPQ